MYSRESRNFFHAVSKTASFMLAVLLIISPIGNLAFASTSEDTPWVYDTARVASNSGVSGQYGDYKEDYIVDLPSGVNGLTPSVQFSYSSQSSGYGSSAGYGWSLSVPAITRLNKNGVDQMYTRSDFHSSYDGELTEVDEDEFIPRVQTSGFRTYIKGDNDWITYSSDGSKYVFGSSTDSLKKAHSTSSDVYAWYLDEIIDANGNKINYEYSKSEGNVYLSKIFYGYDSLGSNAYEVRFVYASTSNDYVSYEPGFAVVNDRVLESVEVYFDSVLVTKYELEYENPIGSSINLLSSIQKIGYDQNGVSTSRSARLFEYGQESTGWTSDVDIASTTPSYLFLQVNDSGQNYSQYSRDQLVDMNGDGLTDWVEGSTVFLNTGDGWESSSSWPALPVSNIHFENRLVDVNGDLLPDIVTSKKESWDPNYSETDVYTKTVRLNQGDGTWVVDSGLANNIPGDFYWQYHNYPSGITYYNRDVFFVDINGDGLNDWLYDGYVYLNNGAGWATTSTWTRLLSASESFDTKWRLSDINSDGLPDLIKSDTVMYDPQFNNYSNVYTNQVWMNLGNGNWERNSDWEATIPSDFNSRFYIQYWNYPGGITYYKNKVYLADVNGDGLNDWLYTDKALLNTGNGWATSTITLPVSTEDLTKSYRLADIDGDTQLDFVRYFYKYFFGTETHTKEALINNSQKQWLLSTTTDEYGAVTSVTYDVTTAKEGGHLLNPSNPIVRYVAAEVNKDPLIGDSVSTIFTYKGGSLYFASSTPTDRRFAGFESVTSETSLGKNKMYYHQGNGSATSSYENADDYAKMGLLYRTEVYDLSNNLYEVTIIGYDLQSLATSSDFVKKTDEITLRYDGDSDHRDIATAYTYSNNTGLLTSKTEYGEVSASLDGSYSDIGSDKRVTEYEYASNGTNNILGLLSKEVLKDNSGTKVSESKYYYDSQALGSVVTGNLTEQEDWVEGNTYVGRQWTYNSLGQKLSETDPRGKTQLYGYDSFGLFISSTTNAVGHNTQYEYDYSSGKVATTTGANGELFVTTYDGLDRQVNVLLSDSQGVGLTLQKTIDYIDIAGAISILETNYLSSTTASKKYTYLDGFGREVQVRTEGEETNQYSVKDYVYGDHGLLTLESLSYYGDWHSRTSPTTNTDLLSVYTYDPLSRITSVETTVGTTNRSYDQWKETITDTANNDKILEYDAFGRLVQVTEEEGTNSYDTTYNWNVRGDLIKITDAEDNVRNLAYDGLGRRISLEDLHDVSDGIFGTWLLGYDAAGNVSSTTDPKGQVVNYSYDGANRVITEDYLGTGYTDVTYDYDSCTNGIARLCSVSNEGATTTYTYTPNGLVATEAKTILSTTYTTEYEYDRMGNQTLITYPDNSEVKYTYNKANRLEKVEQRESGGVFSDIVKDYNYGPHGMVVYQKNGNDSETTKTYDEDELYRLRSIVTTATTTYGTGGPGAELAEIEAELGSFELLSESTEETVEQTFSEGSEVMIPELEAETSSTSVEQTDSVQETDSDSFVAEELNDAPVDETKADIYISVSTEDVTFSLASSTELEISPVTANETSATTSTEIESIDQLELKIENEIIKNQEIEDRAAYVASVKADKKKFKDEADKFTLKLNDENEKNSEVVVEALKNRPEFRMKKWGGEVDMGISYEGLLVDGEAKSVGNLLRWQNASGTKEVHAYPLPATHKTEDSGFEIEVVLTELPEDNVFDFLITGYENLDFFYQPALGDDHDVISDPEVDKCTETECINIDKDVVFHRDENIIGSYAVYHKEKTGRFENIDYETGKVFHIFRPKVIDSKGDETWADLSYNEGVLSVTVPDDFLANAVYPVVVDPTFGMTSVGGSVYQTTSNTQRISAIRASSTNSGVISSINFFSSVTDGGETVGVAIYADNNGAPSNLINSQPWTSYNSVNTTATWRSGALSQILQGGQAYWLAMNTYYRSKLYYDSVTNGRAYMANYQSFYPAPFQSNFSPTYDSKRFSIYANYVANEVPTAPVSLEVDGQTNPVGIEDAVPEFTAIFTDPNSADTATKYQIQVSTSSTFTDLVWDSGMATLTLPISVSSRSESIEYDGDQLATSTTYYWRVKFWDNFNDEGLWSTSTNLFSVATGTAPIIPFTPASGGVQNLLFTYDAVGNIIEIVDSSETTLSGTTTYSYDDLYRLTSASTTGASTTPYTQSYTYSSIGNILTKSDVGSYTYGETSYANPHAATAIAGVTHSYDANGNLVSTTEGDVYTWNYRNQLIESETASSTTTYVYDHAGRRVLKSTGTATTTYPSSLYETTGTSTKKHIYANNILVATIDSDTPAPETYYVYTNHLGSTNVVLGEDGYINQLLDYYPYGDTRIENQYDTHNQTNRYTGHEFDEETELTYAGARYLNSNIGKWISMDPASRDNPNQFLRDPQQFNSYSYARNNPLILIDPDGKKVELVARPVFSSYDAHLFYLVTPDNPSEISINGVPAGTEKFTIGAYNRGGFAGVGNKLTPEFGFEGGPQNTDSPYLTGEKVPTASTQVALPDGMTDSDLINQMGNAANNISKVNYFTLGKTGKFGAANSNNFVNEVGTRAGFGSQVQSFNPSNVYIPGKNQRVPTSNLLQNIQNQINQIRDKLKTMGNNN